MMAKQVLVALIWVAATLAACEVLEVQNLTEYEEQLRLADDKLIVVYFCSGPTRPPEDLKYPENRVLLLMVNLELVPELREQKRYSFDKLPIVYFIHRDEKRKQGGLIAPSTEEVQSRIDWKLEHQDWERQQALEEERKARLSKERSRRIKCRIRKLFCLRT